MYSKKGLNDPKQTRLCMSGSNIGIKSSSHSPLDPEVMRYEVMKMIICTFSFSNNPWFMEWCQYIDLGYVLTPTIPVEVL